jgi:hypothetical protein
MVENTVAPNEVATFEFWLKAPNQGGTFDEYFGPVVEGVQWMRDIGLFYRMHTQLPYYSWQMTSQYAYTDQTKTTLKNMNNLLPGEKAFIGFTARNTGNISWTNTGANPVMVGTANPLDRISSFAPGSGWLSGSRPVLMQNANIAPGQTATFEFTMTAPSTTGTYNERFSLIANDLTWFNDTGLSFYANVHN